MNDLPCIERTNKRKKEQLKREMGSPRGHAHLRCRRHLSAGQQAPRRALPPLPCNPYFPAKRSSEQNKRGEKTIKAQRPFLDPLDPSFPNFHVFSLLSINHETVSTGEGSVFRNRVKRRDTFPAIERDDERWQQGALRKSAEREMLL